MARTRVHDDHLKRAENQAFKRKLESSAKSHSTEEFTLTEKRILTALYNANKHLSTERIAEVAGISRLTAKKYLEELEKKGKVGTSRIGKSIYWWIQTKKLAYA